MIALGAVLSGCGLGYAPNASAPASTISTRDSARAAAIIEDQMDGRISGPAEGNSMQPLYGSNAYLIITPIDYADLEPGMLVAYKDLFGRRVVHALLRKEGKYWTVQGVNNAHEDADYVTEQNLIGVVYGSMIAYK